MATETLKRRIAALRDKTMARGCTEAEALAAAEKALAAAEKAADLMREHGLSDADIEIGEQAVDSRTKGRNPAAHLWPVIAHCTNTASIIVSYVVPPKTEVTFVGCEPGPEIATYLFMLLDRAVSREVARFKDSKFYRGRRSLTTRRQAVADFTVGLVHRLRQRLLELFAPSLSATDRELAQSALAERFPEKETVSRKKHKVRYGEATARGWIAGGDVALAHGVSGRDTRALISNGGDQIAIPTKGEPT